MTKRPSAPPHFVINAVRGLGRGLTSLSRRLAPPPLPLLDIVSGQWRTHALGAVARLGVADHLADGPRDVGDLARACGAHEDSLFRVLRALAADGIFDRTADRTFALNALTQPLRADHPRSIRHTVIQITSEWNQRTWAALDATLADGRPAFPKVYGGQLWEYLDEHPEDGRHFHRSMTELSRLDLDPVLAAYDFGRHGSLVDVGGGSGQLLAGILRVHPRVRGTVYDLEQATGDAPGVFTAAGVADRATVVHGSFYDKVPAGHDAYVMRQILHGHSDEQAGPIFASLRAGMRADAHLLVLDAIVPEGPGGLHPGFLDLQMLVGSGGRERTPSEMAALFAANGFHLTEVIRTVGPTAVFVGRPTT